MCTFVGISMRNKTTIQLDVKTRERLKEKGKKREIYDHIIRRLLSYVD